VALGKQRERRRAQPVDARGVGDPEHGGHDHLEADRFHVRLGGSGVPVGPACENLFGLALHRLVVAGKRVAVERGELRSSPAHVLGAVDVRESRRAEEEMVRGGLGQRRSEAKHAGVGCEDTLDVLGIGQAQPRPRRRHRHQEAVAEPLAVARELLWGQPVLGGIDERGASQSRHVGKRLVHQPHPL
jgi:hypothetical protein